MSGLAAVLAGHRPAGIYRWHAAFEVDDVRHAVEHAGWGFAWVDGWHGGDTKRDLLAAIGAALDFPDTFGRNFDALHDALKDVRADERHHDGTLLLWDGWSTLARADERAFHVVLSVLQGRADASRGGPFAVLLRGDGPEIDVESLD